ncbi:hypothetical protein DMJ13_26520 [halophilic archaeon]|nr:hypothetical protein DMJ13_26520 [halophilic archaeon]
MTTESSATDADESSSTRRTFVRAVTLTAVGADAVLNQPLTFDEENQLQSPDSSQLEPVADMPENVTRPWIGNQFWSNRLQDWRLHDGRIECRRGDPELPIRTVSVLTREVVRKNAPGHISVTAGIVNTDQNTNGTSQGGFCGLLLGVNQSLDYRAAALAQQCSGTGGGFLCTFGRDGIARFREHTSTNSPLAFAELSSEQRTPGEASAGFAPGQRVRLDVDIVPVAEDRFDVRLVARDAESESVLSEAVRRNVPESDLLGSIALVSSPGHAGTRWWFRNLRTGGEKIGRFPDRTFGPIAGALYSLNGSVLKLSAQFMPLGASEPQTAELQYRHVDTDNEWTTAGTADIGTGHTALFRVEDWDPTRNWEYRVVYQNGSGNRTTYPGRIQADPETRDNDCSIGLLGCVVPTVRGFQRGQKRRAASSQVEQITPQQADKFGRYTPDNFYFPHTELVQNVRKQDPNLLVFSGDQYYQNNPMTGLDDKDPTLDYLYKWYLWIWAFRGLTRNRPTVVLTDDHDMYQSNLWGAKGKSVPFNRYRRGGYAGSSEFINLVIRTQCCHNPDPYDPTPVQRGISVYYGAFRYGGVDFAIVESRKFKSPPKKSGDRQLLGKQQRRFLQDWGTHLASGPARVCLTQAPFACIETTPDGQPNKDLDSNGFPKEGRDAAVKLLRDAGALVLSGDRHLSTLVRHGIDTHTDGVVEFTGPAGGTLFQRWFEPAQQLPQSTASPNTGCFTDTFGNKIRVLAVANPTVSYKQFRKRVNKRTRSIGDRQWKREGYGLIHADHDAERFTIECWPWNEDPTAPDADQFPGWPFQLSFDNLASGKSAPHR